MNLQNNIEALLFVSSKPFTLKKLAQILNSKKQDVEKALNDLVGTYKERNGGMRILLSGDSVQMATAPDCSEIISSFLKDETTGEMTRPSLETLAIIAYRGPVTKPEIEQIRGVNCSLILRNLLMRGLVEATEDKKLLQTTYRVSIDLFKYLGLDSISDLPEYTRLHGDEILQVLTGEKQI